MTYMTNKNMNTERYIRTIIILLAFLFGITGGAWAQLSTSDIIIDGSIKHGSVTVTGVNAETRVVTLAVTPASGYFVEKSNIVVQKLVDPSSPNARRRVPDIADALTVSGNTTTTYPATGEYTFTVPADYAGAFVSVTFTGMNPATATVTPNSLTYTGEAQPLVTLGAVVGGAATDPVTYSLTSGGTYTTTIPTAIDAGSYTVYYKVAGDATHSEGNGNVTVTIQQASITEVILAQSVQPHDGTPKTFSITVKAGSLTVPSTGYDLSGDALTQTNSGTYTVTVTGKGNFTGTASATFRILAGVVVIDGSTDKSAVTNPAGTYILAADVSADVFANLSSGTFTGTLDGDFHKITGLSSALFNTISGGTSGGTVKNVILENVNISGSGNVGAIANEMTGTSTNIACIYNCGILSGSVSGTGDVGGLVGVLGSTSDPNQCYARVINCYSFASVSGGANTGGIVGNNAYASKSSTIDGGSIRTMVMNCVFYGTGTGIYPIYGGQIISNEATNGRLNNYNYFSYEKLPTANIIAYNNALAAEDRYLKRFEFYRYLLNSTRELAAWYATGTPNQSEMAKWVLDKEIAEYPILKVQDSNTSGTYPSVVNYDPDYTFDAGSKVARTSVTERNKGKNLGSLTVNISVGSGAPTGAAIKSGKSTISLQRTDKDYEDYKFNYDKVQLPYYNEVGTGNCTQNKVVTGWKITAMGGGTQGTFTASDSWEGYNFADRAHYAKDLYSQSGRVFSQGAYFDVPDGVTSITIEPYWGKAAYLSDATYDCYGVFVNQVESSGDNKKSGIKPMGVNDFGTRYTGGNTYSICGDNQTVYTDFATALGTLSGSGSVYDNAIVLVGNYHQAGPPSTGSKAFTIMSVDQNDDNEPDYCFIFNSNKQQRISPVRFDFVSVPGTTMAHKITSTTFMGIMGNHKWKGWLETTNTTLIRFSQLEYDNEYKTTNSPSPVILLGGIVEQMVSTNGVEGSVTHTKYIHVGGNAWFKIFNNGCHIDKTNTSSPRIPISVTGGDYEKFYLSGYFQPNAPANANDNAECYISGGRFGELAGAGQEEIDGNVTWLIDRADISDFYGGGINDKKPITGNISVTIKNSYVDQYCGGPKFGNMQTDKTVTTTATDCHFGTYFGAGYGGTSLFRFTPSNLAHNKYDQLNYPWDTWLGDANGYTRGKYDSGKGIAVGYEYEQFEGSNDKTVGRLYVNYASLSVAQTKDVTSTLTGCTVTGNFYGGGNLGEVDGTATSTLTDCTVGGSVYGAGFSATAPKADVFPQSGMSPNPNYNTNTGVFEAGGYPAAVEYTWSKTKGASTTANSLVDDADGHWIHTDIDLTTLGAVKGKVTLNIEGTTTVAGNVYGGGESSDAEGDVEVNVNGGTMAHDVYGGGALGHTNTANWDASKNEGAGGWADGKYDASAGTTYTTAVNLTGGTVNGDAYGGGLGDATHAASVYGDVLVTVNGTKIRTGYTTGANPVVNAGRVFGANNLNGTPKGHVKVLVEKTAVVDGQAIDVASVFGGGNQAAYEPVNANDYAEVEIHETTETGHRVIVGNVFGGGNEAGIGNSTNAAGTQVNLVAGSVNTAVYGGCNTSGTISGNTTVTLSGGTVGVGTYDPSTKALTYTSKGNVFGGGFGVNTFVKGNVEVNIGTASGAPVTYSGTATI